MSEITSKYEALRDFLKDKKCILAFSGGSDSTLLAHVLSEVSPDSLLVTVDNKMFAHDFISYTQQKAQEFNLQHKIIEKDFLKKFSFKSNPKGRCYNCRKIMFGSIKRLPEFNEYDFFIEGTNVSDYLEDRPGVLINYEEKMTSPLVECEISKDDVLTILERLNITYSPNTTCLATRIKLNEEVTHEKLKRIDEAEEIAKQILPEMSDIRIRSHEDNAIIVVNEPFEIGNERLFQLKYALVDLGFKKVVLDLMGYHKGELNIKTDNEGNMIQQLPYSIDLHQTYKYMNNNEKLENDHLSVETQHIKYDDITISENGKISMPENTKFEDKLFKVITSIKRRKEI